MSNRIRNDDSSPSLSSGNTECAHSSYFKSDKDSNSINKISTTSDVENDEVRSKLPLCSIQQNTNVSSQTRKGVSRKNDSLPKERKKWIRPPIIGQDSISDGSLIISRSQSSCSSGSEEEVQPHISLRSDKNDFRIESIARQVENDSGQTLEGSSDHSMHHLTDSNEFQRIPTPSSISSVTSRRLEWDSGADVGYYQEYEGALYLGNELSSIEKIALDQGGSQKVLLRSDPEGSVSLKKLQGSSKLVSIIGVPTSESTPISCNNSTQLKKSNSCSNSHTCFKYQHIIPKVIIKKREDQSDSSVEGVPHQANFTAALTSSPKKCSSMENIRDKKFPETQNATFPRSQSQINLTKESELVVIPHLQKINHPPQSVSCSSVSTVITGLPSKNSKCVQTSHHNNNAATQSSLQEATRKFGKCTSIDQNNSSTLESAQMSADDRVNSFEYLPGHMYENAQKPDEANLKENTKISLTEDIERGVHLLEKFISGSNANNTLKKRELIQRVVDRIIKIDYSDDRISEKSMPVRCSTRRSQNRDEAIGESSSENRQPSLEGHIDNSSSLSGQSSSVWPSVTESTKSSDKSEIKPNSAKKMYVGGGKSKPPIRADGSSDAKSDWKASTTKAEKVYENKKKVAKNAEEPILDFLNSERENQLDWIVKEINHLSNLKSLLEKHEKLRRNLQRLKKAREEKNTFRHQNVEGSRRKHHLGSNLYNKQSTEHRNTRNSKKIPALSEEEAWDSHNYEVSDGLRLKKSVSTETRKEDFSGITRSTAYTITFEPTQKPKKQPEVEIAEKPLIADRSTLLKESKEFVKENYYFPSLQDCLLKRRPDVVSRAEIRRKTVAELAAVRQLRQQKRPSVLAAALSDCHLMPPPPPPLIKRVVSQKEMRKQTEMKYRQTFEVKKKISERKSKEMLNTNRLMADIYNKRLQLLTLKGQTNLSNSMDVITTV